MSSDDKGLGSADGQPRPIAVGDAVSIPGTVADVFGDGTVRVRFAALGSDRFSMLLDEGVLRGGGAPAAATKEQLCYAPGLVEGTKWTCRLIRGHEGAHHDAGREWPRRESVPAEAPPDRLREAAQAVWDDAKTPPGGRGEFQIVRTHLVRELDWALRRESPWSGGEK